MTTLTFTFDSYENALKFAESSGDAYGLTNINISNDVVSSQSIERIVGLPYTNEQLKEAVERSTKQYSAGQIITIEELRTKHPRL